MSIAELESQWREAVEGMKFFGEPVQDMDAERLLLVIGFLSAEKRRMEEAYRRREGFLKAAANYAR